MLSRDYLAPISAHRLLQRFPNVLFVALVPLLLMTGTLAQARLPWFVGNFAADLNDPLTLDLVLEKASLYCQGAGADGDPAILPPEVPAISYLGATSIWHQGFPDIPVSQPLMDLEHVFFHNRSPEGGVGWHDQGNVYLRWEPDYRFVAVTEVGDPAKAAATVDLYQIWHQQDGQEWAWLATVDDSITTYTHEFANPLAEHHYRIVTVRDAVEYPYYDANNPLTVYPDDGIRPVITLRDKQYVEPYIRAVHNVFPDTVTIVWRVDFDVVDLPGVFNPDSLKVHLADWDWDYDRPDSVIFSVSSDVEGYYCELEFPGNFKPLGGGQFRFMYRDGEDVCFYPRQYRDGESFIPCYYSPTLNYRQMTTNWWSYQLNPCEADFQAAYRDIAAAMLSSGYDGIFVDNVQDELPGYSYIRKPYAYPGDTAYAEGIRTLVTDAANSLSWADFYLNSQDAVQIGSLSDLANVRGYLIDNWINMASWEDFLPKALWAVNQYTSKAFIQYTQGYDFNCPGSDLSDSGDALRLQALASWLFIKEKDDNRSTLYGFDNWAPDYPPDVGSRITLLPEQFIDFGEPTYEACAGYEWLSAPPSLGALEGYNGDDKLIFDINGEKCVIRTFEKGFAIINYTWPKFSPTLGYLESSTGIDFPDMVYELELDNKYVQVTSGGTLWTSAPLTATSEIDFIPRHSKIFMYDPIASPDVDQQALYALPAADGFHPLLAVRASHWNGEELAELRIDTRGHPEFGWLDDVILNDRKDYGDIEAGDGIYSWAATPIPTVPQDDYEFPIIATGSDGLMLYSTVRVTVAAPPNLAFSDVSDSTGALSAFLEADNSSVNTVGPIASLAFSKNSTTSVDYLFVAAEEPDVGQLFQRYQISPTGVPQFSNETDDFYFGQEPIDDHYGIAPGNIDNDGPIELLWPTIKPPAFMHGAILCPNT